MTVSINSIIGSIQEIQRDKRVTKKSKRERKMAAARMNEYREMEDRKRRMAEILKAGEGLCQVVWGKKMAHTKWYVPDILNVIISLIGCFCKGQGL